MAMRTVGRLGRRLVDARSRRQGRPDPADPPGPEQHHPEGEARHRDRHPCPPQHRTGAVGQRRADRPGQLRPQPEGEDRPDHEQAHRQDVGPVPGQLAPGGLPPPRQHRRLGRGRLGPRRSPCGLPASGSASSSSGPTRDHAASWSRASPKVTPPTTTHNSISSTPIPRGFARMRRNRATWRRRAGLRPPSRPG